MGSSESKLDSAPTKIQLRLLEAYTRDGGRGVARIDLGAMDALDNLLTGEVVRIMGKKTTAAKVLPLYPSDEHRGIVRADGLIRYNSGAALGDMIVLTKAKAAAATELKVTAEEGVPPMDERYLARAMELIPVMKGDKVTVPYFGRELNYFVEEMAPNEPDVLIVTLKTRFVVFIPTPPQSHLETAIAPMQVQIGKLAETEAKLKKRVKVLGEKVMKSEDAHNLKKKSTLKIEIRELQKTTRLVHKAKLGLEVFVRKVITTYYNDDYTAK